MPRAQSPDKLHNADVRLVSRIVALLLLVEAALTMAWLASLLSTIRVYGGLTLMVIAARTLDAALQFTGFMLLSRAPGASAAPAIRIAPLAVLASAALTTTEVGWRLTPSNLDPTFRWPFIIGYWLYAALLLWLLARLARAQ